MVDQKVFVTDFDGTMTRVDFFRLALEHLPESALAPWSRFEEGKCSHFDALAEIFARLRLKPEQYQKIMEQMQFDPEAADAVSRLKQAGWRVEVASAGSVWYIRQILEQHRLDLVIHANLGEISPEGGLILGKPVGSPFCSPADGIDKLAVVQHYQSSGAEVAYAGDGRPDLAAALQVPPRFRFATGWLAEELERRGEQFHLFESWHRIAALLLGGE